jgi:membrane associated rhomboid family serine protease
MPNPRGTPVVNYLLLGVNIAVYLLVAFPLSRAAVNPNDPALLEYVQAVPQYWNMPLSELLRRISAYDLFIFSHGFKPASPSVTDLFASMFLHAGFLHLAGNMLFLWIYGDNVEHRLGSVAYLLVYLATGIAATAFFTVFRLQSTVPMIGASGAISGVLGLYFLWFPRNKVKVFVVLFPFFVDTILLPARIVLGFYLVVDNLLPFLFASGQGGGVAHGAHIGGFVAGLAIAFGTDRLPEMVKLAGWRSFWRREVDGREAPDTAAVSPRTADVHERIQRGDLKGAVAAYFSLPVLHLKENILAGDRLQIGYFLLKEGHYAEALSVFRHYISDYPAGPSLDRANLGAGVVLYQGLGQLTSAYQYFLSVLDVDPDPDSENQARQYLAAIEARQKRRLGRS